MYAEPLARARLTANENAVRDLTFVSLLLLLILILRRCRLDRFFVRDTAQRAAEEMIGGWMQRATLHHLLLELRIAHAQVAAQFEEHVRHGAVTRARPVARIGYVLVRRRIVHVADHVHDRALREKRGRIIRVVI